MKKSTKISFGGVTSVDQGGRKLSRNRWGEIPGGKYKGMTKEGRPEKRGEKKKKKKKGDQSSFEGCEKRETKSNLKKKKKRPGSGIKGRKAGYAKGEKGWVPTDYIQC